MKRSVNISRPCYFSYYQRLLAALLAAYYIIIEGQPGPFYRTVQSYDFLITMVFSSVIAVILIELVHWITVLLDRYLPWQYYLWPRLALQVLLGVLMVIEIDLVLVKFFFRLFRYDFESSGYLVSEFPLVKWMIYLLNIYYWTCHYAPGLFDVRRLFSALRKTPMLPPSKSEENTDTEEGSSGQVLVLRLGSRVRHVPTDQVACFKKESAAGYAYLKDGSVWNFDYRISELVDLLPKGMFFQTSRGIIYSLEVIENYRRERKEGILILKPGVDLEVSRTVSRERYMEFRECFDAYQRSTGTLGSDGQN